LVDGQLRKVEGKKKGITATLDKNPEGYLRLAPSGKVRRVAPGENRAAVETVPAQSGEQMQGEEEEGPEGRAD